MDQSMSAEKNTAKPMGHSPRVPTLYTERLILKPIQLSDAEGYEKYFVDYEIISHLAAVVPWPYPKGGVADFLANVILPQQGTKRWTWAIFIKENPSELIGCVDIWRDPPPNRGFWLGKKFWGNGYMTEAVEQVTKYAFEQLGFEKFVFANALGNERSKRIKEKTGARFLRIAPAKFVNPDYKEQELWELTKADWEKVR